MCPHQWIIGQLAAVVLTDPLSKRFDDSTVRSQIIVIQPNDNGRKNTVKYGRLLKDDDFLIRFCRHNASRRASDNDNIPGCGAFSGGLVVKGCILGLNIGKQHQGQNYV